MEEVTQKPLPKVSTALEDLQGGGVLQITARLLGERLQFGAPVVRSS